MKLPKNGSLRKFFTNSIPDMVHVHSLNAISLEASYLTVGTFDGVHRGHVALLKPMMAHARNAGVKTVVLTFHPHPAIVLGRRTGTFCLTSPEERASLLLMAGIDYVITEPFTPELSAVSATAFVQHLKEHLGLKSLWIGHDFALGHGREGNEAFLRKMGAQLDFEVNAIDAHQDDGVISSTRIRNLLWSGEVKLAARLLGRPYALDGLVVPGDQRGRTIGIPTANLQTGNHRLIPANGVYACFAEIEGATMRAAVNIGVRPTFDGQNATQHVEAHLLDFSGDLYGKTMRLHFVDRLRGEQRFASVADLVAQIQVDVRQVRALPLEKDQTR